jgi:hypothetical protein
MAHVAKETVYGRFRHLPELCKLDFHPDPSVRLRVECVELDRHIV